MNFSYINIQKISGLFISQNHRMVGVGRDLCGSSSPTPLPKQGHLEQAPQDLVQVGLEYLQRSRLHNLSEQNHNQEDSIYTHRFLGTIPVVKTEML